jgi:hypothetical protein
MVLRYGCIPTIFVTGETARAHAPLLEELLDRGAEIGLLVAPHQSLNNKKSGYMGVLSLQQQADAVASALQRFQQALGFRPTVVRTGLYSGNAATYVVLAQAQFTHIASRMPGAALPVIGTVWTPDLSIRTQDGIVDVPVTTEPEEKLEPKRLATTWDIFQTCQSISKEFETQVLVDRIVNQVVSAMTPAAAPSIPDKLKEALKERGINPESVATAD